MPDRDLTACTELNRPEWPCLCARCRPEAPWSHIVETRDTRGKVRVKVYKQKLVRVVGGHAWEWRKK
jgi:hypothetical protein